MFPCRFKKFKIWQELQVENFLMTQVGEELSDEKLDNGFHNAWKVGRKSLEKSTPGLILTTLLVKCFLILSMEKAIDQSRPAGLFRKLYFIQLFGVFC